VLCQVFLNLYIAVSYLNHTLDFIFNVLPAVIILIVVFSAGLCLFMVKELLRLARKEKDAEIALARLEESNFLISTLKAKQHDFANHLQVLYGLVERGEKRALKKYMEYISNDLKTVDRITGLKCVEVAALLCKKMALSENVVIEPVIKTDLKHLSLPPDKVISILGNLIDNAVFEAQRHEEINNVRIEISEDKEFYIFEIWNPGHIPPQLFDKIFEPGFSTKGEKGSGMGLPIVKRIIEKFGGKLELISRKGSGTTFRVYLPKKETSLPKAN